MDTQKGGKEKPWRKLRIKPEFNMAEEERKRAFVERVTGTLREKLKDGSLGGGEDEPNADAEAAPKLRGARACHPHGFPDH